MERRAGWLKMPRYRQGSISLFALLPATWDQGLRMPQNMEIKIVRWSGNSANEGLNLGAGMHQQFGGNRRRRSGEDQGFHGACWCRWKQFRELGGTNLLALTVVWEWGLHRLHFFSRSHVEESFAVPRWAPPRSNLFGPQRCVVVIQANSLPGLFLVYFKENSDYWIGLLGGLAWTALHAFHGGIHVWDIATVNSAEAYNGMLYWINGYNWRNDQIWECYLIFLPPEKWPRTARLT